VSCVGWSENGKRVVGGVYVGKKRDQNNGFRGKEGRRGVIACLAR
jgi:hypothetical protein